MCVCVYRYIYVCVSVSLCDESVIAVIFSPDVACHSIHVTEHISALTSHVRAVVCSEKHLDLFCICDCYNHFRGVDAVVARTGPDRVEEAEVEIPPRNALRPARHLVSPPWYFSACGV